MSLKNVKEIGKNQSELTLHIEKSEFDAEVMRVYRKNVTKINIPGFRKGKAPKSIIEKMYGSAFFYDEALNNLLPKIYDESLEESKLLAVSRPEIDVTSIDDEGVLLTAKVYTKPEAEIKEYKGLSAVKEAVSVTEEDIEAEINQVRQRNARKLIIEDRAAENGDEVIIDFEGFVDGVAFEGGKGEKYNLKLGSGMFIPGFEEQIVGKNTGEDFDVNVKFPEDYGAENLAGKDSVFKVKLHEIKNEELPELDDEFVKDVSEDLNTVDEYKADIKSKITERKEKTADRAFEESLIDALLENVEVDIPDSMIESEIDSQVRDYEYRLQSQGGNLQMYYQYTGMDENGLRDSMRQGAERQVKTRLALEAVIKAENIKPTEDEIEEEYKKIASGYNIELEQVKNSLPAEGITEDVSLRKAVDFIKENAVVKKEKAEKKPKEESAPAEKPAAKKPAAAKAKPAAKTTAAKKTTTAKTAKTTKTTDEDGKEKVE